LKEKKKDVKNAKKINSKRWIFGEILDFKNWNFL